MSIACAGRFVAGVGGTRRRVGSPVDASAKRRPTTADVAAKAGGSRALVSIIFPGRPAGGGRETRERVLRVADEIGYRPDSAARLLARGRSRTLGVMFTVHQTFHSDLIAGICPEAERLGYDVLLSAATHSREEAKAVEALLGHRCEAVILLGSDADAAHLDERTRTSYGHRPDQCLPGRDAPPRTGVRGASHSRRTHRAVRHRDGRVAPDGARARAAPADCGSRGQRPPCVGAVDVVRRGRESTSHTTCPSSGTTTVTSPTSCRSA